MPILCPLPYGRGSVLVLVALAAFAQPPAALFEKAPPEVEDALRARINAFYQAHVDGRFREAEKLVAEDTKDFFYVSNKPKILKFHIEEITWSDHFTKARAKLVCEMFVPIAGFMDKPMHVPMPSTWKIENGQWMWYVDPEALRASPMGRMTPGPGTGGHLPAKLPDEKEAMKLANNVKVDRSHVTLDVSKPTVEKVVVSNGMPGPVDLQLNMPGGMKALKVTIDPPQVPGGGKSIVTLTSVPGTPVPKAPVVINLYVPQFGRLIPIWVQLHAQATQ